jgi:tRNA G18 (ribose-2'-O)-methylase SpoU
VRLAEEALISNWPVELVLYTEELSVRGQKIIDAFRLRGVEIESVSPQVMRSASDTEHWGILASCGQAGD